VIDHTDQTIFPNYTFSEPLGGSSISIEVNPPLSPKSFIVFISESRNPNH